MIIKYLIISSRPKQWIKNLLVFIAPFLSYDSNTNIFINSLISFFCFCLISSSVYLLNDVLDFKKDKLHPVKKLRPIASGKLSKNIALKFSIFILLISFLLGSLASYKLLMILTFYVLIQISYCTVLKEKPILDIFCIASGFLLRAISGGVSNNILISPWFVLSIGLLALFLAIEKRKAELRYFLNGGNETRKVLKRYTLPMLLRMENIVSTSTFVSYSLWAVGPQLNGANSKWMILTIPFVLIGLFRYQLISDPNETLNRFKNGNKLINPERPEEILWNDIGIKLSIISWSITFVIIYFISYYE